MIEIQSGKGAPPPPTEFYDYTDVMLAAHTTGGHIRVFIDDGSAWAIEETDEYRWMSERDRRLDVTTVVSWTVFTPSYACPPPEGKSPSPTVTVHGELGQNIRGPQFGEDAKGQRPRCC